VLFATTPLVLFVLVLEVLMSTVQLANTEDAQRTR